MKFSYKYQAERKKQNNCQSHWDDGTVKQLGERLAEFYSKLKEQTGGILIFFPSYPALDQCYVAWQTLFSTIGRQSYKEVRDKEEAKKALAEYRRMCNESDKGPVLFCVFRGKFAEGHDFKDHFCRNIALVGQPNLAKTPKYYFADFIIYLFTK